MTLAIAPLAEGMLIEWEIEDIFRHWSEDILALGWHEYCQLCNDDAPHEICVASPAPLAKAWEWCLEDKRDNDCMDAVRESIREHGFLRPLTACLRRGGHLTFADGHHRLIAAYEQGYRTVPVLVTLRAFVAADSGEWMSDDFVRELPPDVDPWHVERAEWSDWQHQALTV